MFLSRFWYLVLATMAGAALAAYLIAVGQYNLARGDDLESLLIKDRVQVEAQLKLDARARIDALQGVAVDEAVRIAVAQVQARGGGDEARLSVREALLARLRVLNDNLQEVRGDFLAALDDRGRVIAQVGLLENMREIGYGQFPLVDAALRGYLRDDVWRLDDRLYRVAARPIIQGGQYVGAILHGMEFNSALPERLFKVAGVQVAFFLGPSIVASHASRDAASPSSGELGSPLATVLASEQFRSEGRTEIVDVGSGHSGIYSKLTGEAAAGDAGYVVTRPRVAVADPIGFALDASTQATEAVPWPILGGGVVAAFLIGIALVLLERDRPFGKLRRLIVGLNAQDRLDVSKLSGPYRRLAIGINETLDRALQAAVTNAAPPQRREANLDAILGPTPGRAAPASPFAFRGMEDGAEMVPSAPPSSAPAQPSAAAAPPPQSPMVARAPALAPTPAPPSVSASAAAPTPAVAPPHASAPAGRAAPAAAYAATLAIDNGARPAPAPGPVAPPRPTSSAGNASKATMLGMPGVGATPAAAPVFPPSHAGARAAAIEDEDGGATVISRVPDELLARTAAPPADGNSEEAHFRQIFAEFVETKKRCGEPVESLTFDKFVVTLRKNKDSLVQRYQCKTVRFQVYVKEGKAALRATPVKA